MHCFLTLAAELDDKYSLEFPDDGKKLVFKGKTRSYESAGHTEKAREYALELELFDAVIPDQVKTRLTGKSLFFTVPKKELKTEYWPRLTKNKAKLQFVKTDFDRWVDEDEQDGAADADAGDVSNSTVSGSTLRPVFIDGRYERYGHGWYGSWRYARIRRLKHGF